jgi:hypothetical protein
MDASSSSGGGGGGAAKAGGDGVFGGQQQQQQGPPLEYCLKFETQMYKIREDEYSFDIQVRVGRVRRCCAAVTLRPRLSADMLCLCVCVLQRLDGELLLFMDVCGRLLADIRA